MGCKKTDGASTGNREAIDGMFERGHVKGAAWQRKERCANANECGMFCEWMSKEPGQPPWCVDPETGAVHSSDLYADYKRRDFKCPDNRF